MGKLTKNYFYNLSYQIFVFVVPLITAPYLARTLGANQLGIYSYVYSVTSIVNTISLLGTHTYGYRQIAYTRDDRGEYNIVFWDIFSLRILLGIAGSIAYFIGAILSAYPLQFLLYYPWLLASYMDCSYLYVGLEEMKYSVARNFAVKIISIIGIFLFVNSSEDLNLYIVVMSVSALIGVITIYPGLKKYISRPLSHYKEILSRIKKHFVSSIQLFLPSAAPFIYLQIDKIMIEAMTIGTAQISYYDQAEKIAQLPLTVISVLSTVIMPRIANSFKNGNDDDVYKYVIKSFQFSLCLAIPMTVGMFIVSDDFIPLYLGSEFLPTIVALKILSPLIVLSSVGTVIGTQYFTATNQIGYMLIANVTAFISNIICNSILIPVYGHKGAAIATLLASAISALVQLFFFRKTIHLLSVFKKVYKYLISAIIMGLVVACFKCNLLNLPTVLNMILYISVGVCTYFLTCFILRDELIIGILRKLGGK